MAFNWQKQLSDFRDIYFNILAKSKLPEAKTYTALLNKVNQGTRLWILVSQEKLKIVKLAVQSKVIRFRYEKDKERVQVLVARQQKLIEIFQAGIDQALEMIRNNMSTMKKEKAMKDSADSLIILLKRFQQSLPEINTELERQSKLVAQWLESRYVVGEKGTMVHEGPEEAPIIKKLGASIEYELDVQRGFYLDYVQVYTTKSKKYPALLEFLGFFGKGTALGGATIAAMAAGEQALGQAGLAAGYAAVVLSYLAYAYCTELITKAKEAE